MTSAAPERHRFTVEEYHRMGETGLLGENDRVELVEGELIDMAPMGSRHNACVDRLTRLLVGRLGERAIVRVQGSVWISEVSEPEPDIAVLVARADFYASALPGPAEILLVVEVADTTVGWDRSVKTPMYGRAGVAEAWVIDLTTETVETWTAPGPEGYAVTRRAGRGGELDVEGITVTVEEILG